MLAFEFSLAVAVCYQIKVFHQVTLDYLAAMMLQYFLFHAGALWEPSGVQGGALAARCCTKPLF